MRDKSSSSDLEVPPTPRCAKRDGRIDFFRGVALLCIFIDHIPGNFVSRLTLHNMGFSDAAELYVLLAGVSSALAWSRRADREHLILRRAGRIYLAHVTLVFFVATLLAASAAALGEGTLWDHRSLTPFLNDLPAAIGRTLTLTLQPEYIDILPLYLVLLLWLPLLLRLIERSRGLALAVAIAVWAAAGLTNINLPGARNGGWFFNPFAWQLIFSIGVIIGSREVHGTFEPRLPRSRVLLAGAVTFLLFSFVLSAPWTQLPIGTWRDFRILPIDFVGEVSKTGASPWRIVHVLSLAYVTAWLVPRDVAWLDGWVAVGIRELGRRPLTMFMLASVSSYAAGIAFTHCGKGIAVQLACNLVGLFLLTGVGNARRQVGSRLRVGLRRWRDTGLGAGQSRSVAVS